MNRPSDWLQREQARDPRHSCIVQAPAGSGKTELLTQRMLGLLTTVENPEEVIAITFTRKAAAEMKHRLVQHLRQAARWLDEPDPSSEPLAEHQQVSRDLALAVLENGRHRDWNLLEHSSRLRIRTIDSLCSELARQLPILSGLGGGQQIAQDANALYRLAAIRTMAAVEDDEDENQADVVCLLDRYDNQYDKLVNLLTVMLGNREQWLTHLLDARTSEGFDREGLEESLRFLVEAQLKTALELTPTDLLNQLPAILRYALGNQPKDAAQLEALLEAAGGMRGESLTLSDSAEMLPHWNTLIRRLVTAGAKSWLKQVNANAGFPAPSGAKGEEKQLRTAWKQSMSAVLDAFRPNDELLDVYRTILTLPAPGYEDEAWESLQSMMNLLIRSAREWKVVLAETGQADFSEVATRAIESLGSADAPSELALRMDYRISHLLVDEFQDTSNSQIQLLERLTEGWTEGDGRTVFLVGDPMQSIYRFRKAEVSLFIQAWNGQLLDHIRLLPLQLQVNFRSNQPIVDWINQVFPRVMPRRNDPVMGAVSYSAALCRPDVCEEGDVELNLMPGRDQEQEACEVLEIIRQREEKETLAILVRSRSHASTILTALDEARESDPRFRYQAIDFNPLAGTPLIQDLVSLTLALSQPANRLAWLAILRAPFIGLDLADLDALVDGNAHGIILDAVIAAAEDAPSSRVTTDGLQRLQRVAGILETAMARRGRQAMRSLLEATWVELGGPACVGNRSELEDAATYFDLIETLESEDLPIDQDTLQQRMSKLYAEPDADAGGNLQIMTMYAAKGLQFDHVILPGLNRKPSGDREKLLHWFELAGEDRIVMSPMRNNADKKLQKSQGDLIAFISGVEKKRKALEDGRLLYVAATRAIRGLHLFGAIKPGSGGQINPQATSLLACLWPAIELEQSPRLQEEAERLLDQESITDDNDEGSGLNLPQIFRRLDADWRLPAAPDAIELTRADSLETRDYIEFSWAGEDARLTGNLVHRLLQLIARQSVDYWHWGGGLETRKDWCRQQLSSEGIDGARADQIIQRAGQAIRNCLSSEKDRWILDANQEAHSEFALTAVLDGQPTNLVLDRTFVDQGTRWIVDYKTSSHAGGDLEGFLRSEMDRYHDQLERYQQAMSLNETRPIRTALYFPLLDRFCVTEQDQEE